MPTAFERLVPPALLPFVRSEAFGQLVRFAVAGLGVTIFCILVYLAAAISLGVDPMIANVISHFAGVATGYAIHSRWSFKAEPGREGAMLLRFTIASGMAFGLNSLWVWLAVHAFHGPAWLPVPAMMFVTPLASFVLNRWWVFGKGGVAA